VASRVGGWQWSWAVTGGCAVAGLVLASLAASLTRGHDPAPGGKAQPP
jgi:MFS transporter, CP family, cyanate transporter